MIAYIDTNIIIRFLTQDDATKQKKVAKLFHLAQEEKVVLHTPSIVIAESIYVLTSKRLYALKREAAAQLLDSLIKQINLKVEDAPIMQQALHMYAQTSLDFADCVLLHTMQRKKIKKLYSFDRDFDSFATIDRHEP